LLSACSFGYSVGLAHIFCLVSGDHKAADILVVATVLALAVTSLKRHRGSFW
jgi:hypothetical protein